MKISELKAGQGNVNIEITVKSVEEPRTIDKYGRKIRLANAVVTDGESEIKLTLWNDDVDKVKEGSIIKITNGYINEFQGEKQLTTGKFGKMEIAGGKSGKKESKEDKDSSEDSEEGFEDSGEESEDTEDY